MDWQILIRTFVTLVVIIDPLGNTVVYLALKRDAEVVGRWHFADQATLAAAAVIFLFAFFGEYILDYLGISIESLMVAGGLLLGIVALDMMKGRLDSESASIRGANLALVPMGTPLLAGPGAVVAAMLLMTRQPESSGKLLVSAGILAALLVVWISLRMAERVVGVLRETGVDLLTRIMGILLAAIAVEFVYQAIAAWVG